MELSLIKYNGGIMKKEQIKVEVTQQIKFAVSLLKEKLGRTLPFVPSEIIIKGGEITVKE